MESKKIPSWSLQTRIYNLLQKESSCDVEFLVSVPPRRFMCHKAILAAGSEVFETMFFGTIKQKTPVRVPDVTAKGFALILQYLYSDEASIQDESEAFEAAYASKKYMIESLFSTCEAFLLENLTLHPENIFSILEEANFLQMTQLQNHCLRYISRHTNKIFHAKSFTKASKDTFQDILRMNVMNIESEIEIIEALWLWGQEQCKENGIKCSAENVRSCTKEFLKYVRFFALKMDELVSILEKCQILDTSEEMALLWNIAMPTVYKEKRMPSNICTESKTRSIFNSRKIEFPAKYRYDGNMSAFLIENYQKKIEITVSGPPVTVIGVVVAYKPIPCYSRQDRSLEIQISATTSSSTMQSSAKSRFNAESSNAKDEEKQLLLLDNYIVIEEQQIGILNVFVTGEGVRLMQCVEDEFHYDLGKSEVIFKFDNGEVKNNRLFPVKELMLI